MPASRKKWIVLAVSLASIAAVALFLLKAIARSEVPATPAPAAIAADNPEHELKELAVQLQRKPGHIPVLLRMAQLEREKGALDDAAGHLREAVKGEPSNQDAHLELGRLLYERNDVTGALAETGKVLALNPNQVDALYNMGAIYANLGNPERARSYWSRAIAAGPAADSSRKAREGLKKLDAGS
jgi:cytochrome c-type biogenesis protein CcmH/NrfG